MAKKYHRLFRPLSVAVILFFISQANSQELINKTSIIVNESVIVESEIVEQTNKLKQQATATQQKLPNADALQKMVTDHLILRSIKLQLAKEQGIKATRGHVDGVMERLAKQNNISITQLVEVIKQQEGNYLQFRKTIANDFIINQLEQNTIHSRIQINEQDLKDQIRFIETERNKDNQYHLIHYFIQSSSKDKSQLKNAGNLVRQSLIEEQTINDIKQILDSSITLNKKDLGLLSAKSLPNIFIKGVKGLSQGQFSQLLTTASGLHILKVLKKEGAARIIVPEVQARHILLKPNKLRTERSTLIQITKLKQQLRSGADFSTLAKKHSEDPGSAINGGDLNWFATGKMVAAFDAQLVKLKVGELSEPFKTQFGWHIVQLQGKRNTDITDSKIKELAQQNLINKKVETDKKRWENRIRQEAYIEFL